MAKRRTKREKEKPHYSFLISYKPESSHRPSNTNVKGQIQNRLNERISQNNLGENAKYSAQESDIEFIKHDIIKSVFLVSLILALELMIYLAVRTSVL